LAGIELKDKIELKEASGHQHHNYTH